MPRSTNCRLVILHKNVNNILAQITTAVASEGINIANLSNQSRGNYAATIIDTDTAVPEKAIKHITDAKDIIRVRVIN